MRLSLLGPLVLAALMLLGTAVANADSQPIFILGFKALAAEIPDVVGEPLENENWAANGDSLQRTSRGLMVWRKADNWTAFTDGYRTWVNGPFGVQERLNDQLFDWEHPASAVGSLPIPSSDLTGLAAMPNVKVVYYDISGSTEQELIAQMELHLPGEEDGMPRAGQVEWSVQWSFTPAKVQSDGRCQPSDVKVRYQAVVTLPRWMPPAGTSPALIDRFSRFSQALAEHERGHVQILVDSLPELVSAIEAAGCSSASDAGSRGVAAIQQMERDYDNATRHGVAQGTVL